MRGVKISAHPVHKPIKIDTIGAVISVTSGWDDEGRRQIKVLFKCKSDRDALWAALRTNASTSDMEIAITRYENKKPEK